MPEDLYTFGASFDPSGVVKGVDQARGALRQLYADVDAQQARVNQGITKLAGATGEAGAAARYVSQDFRRLQSDFAAGTIGTANYGRELGILERMLGETQGATATTEKSTRGLWQILNATGGASMRTGLGLG